MYCYMVEATNALQPYLQGTSARVGSPSPYGIGGPNVEVILVSYKHDVPIF